MAAASTSRTDKAECCPAGAEAKKVRPEATLGASDAAMQGGERSVRARIRK